MVDKALAAVKKLAENTPHLLVLVVLVWLSLGYLERAEARRDETLSSLGAACHLHQEKTTHDVTLALEAQIASNRELCDLLIVIKTLLATRGSLGES